MDPAVGKKRKRRAAHRTRTSVDEKPRPLETQERATPRLDKIVPTFRYDPCINGVLPAPSFGSSICIICNRKARSEMLLKLPCSHEAHPYCFPYAKEKPGCCPACEKPICYKICGHRIWHKLLPSIMPSTREFDGICIPCGGTSEARRRWNVVDREQPVYQVQAPVQNYADYIKADDYMLFNSIHIDSSSAKPDLQSPLGPPSALSCSELIAQPIDGEAPEVTERRAARYRYMVWDIIGTKYAWRAPREIFHVKIQDVVKHRRTKPDSLELDVDAVLQRCRRAVGRAYEFMMNEGKIAEGMRDPLINAKEKYKVLRIEWFRLEELWLQLKLVECRSHSMDALTRSYVSERETRHLWVRQLQKTTDAAMEFCLLPELKKAEQVSAD